MLLNIRSCPDEDWCINMWLLPPLFLVYARRQHSDVRLAKAIRFLVKAGHADQLFLSNGVYFKFQLARYGGFGLSYLRTHFLPRHLCNCTENDAVDVKDLEKVCPTSVVQSKREGGSYQPRVGLIIQRTLFTRSRPCFSFSLITAKASCVFPKNINMPDNMLECSALVCLVGSTSAGTPS